MKACVNVRGERGCPHAATATAGGEVSGVGPPAGISFVSRYTLASNFVMGRFMGSGDAEVSSGGKSATDAVAVASAVAATFRGGDAVVGRARLACPLYDQQNAGDTHYMVRRQ